VQRDSCIFSLLNFIEDRWYFHLKLIYVVLFIHAEMILMLTFHRCANWQLYCVKKCSTVVWIIEPLSIGCFKGT
jgi:hypothetical protein